MSTESATSQRRYRLAERVSIRPERFGALAYNHDTRRLVVIRSPRLAALLATGGAVAAAGALAPSLQRLEQMGIVRAA